MSFLTRLVLRWMREPRELRAVAAGRSKGTRMDTQHTGLGCKDGELRRQLERGQT